MGSKNTPFWTDFDPDFDPLWPDFGHFWPFLAVTHHGTRNFWPIWSNWGPRCHPWWMAFWQIVIYIWCQIPAIFGVIIPLIMAHILAIFGPLLAKNTRDFGPTPLIPDLQILDHFQGHFWPMMGVFLDPHVPWTALDTA